MGSLLGLRRARPDSDWCVPSQRLGCVGDTEGEMQGLSDFQRLQGYILCRPAVQMGRSW